jgi:hypothetical protein
MMTRMPKYFSRAVQQGNPGDAFHPAKGEIEGTDNGGNKGGHRQFTFSTVEIAAAPLT